MVVSLWEIIMHGTALNGFFIPDVNHYLSNKVTKEDLQAFFSHPVFYNTNEHGDLPVRLIYLHLMSEEVEALLSAAGATIVEAYYGLLAPEVSAPIYELWNKKLGKEIIGKPLVPLSEEAVVEAVSAPKETQEESKEEAKETTPAKPVAAKRKPVEKTEEA
jgi:hypothetical protein